VNYVEHHAIDSQSDCELSAPCATCPRREYQSDVAYASFPVAFIGVRLNKSSLSGCTEDSRRSLGNISTLSSGPSPNRKALCSRLALTAFRPDPKKGEELFGDVDLSAEGVCSSGSNMKAKDDWARLDRVGTGIGVLFGTSGTSRDFVFVSGSRSGPGNSAAA